jgi:hypothetical protein
MMSAEDIEERCPRCGQVDCDIVPDGYWEKLRARFDAAPTVRERDEPDVEPLL